MERETPSPTATAASAGPLRRVGRWAAFLLAPVIAACTAPPQTVEPVGDFDLDRYLGTWVELYRLDHSFERGLTNVTATYERRDDGKIAVINRGWNPETCAWETAEGSARFRGDRETASLAVSFFGPFEGGYHVFALSPDYDLAAVSGPTTGYLWILAREDDHDPSEVDRFIQDAAARGFPVEQLIDVPHGDPVCDTG